MKLRTVGLCCSLALAGCATEYVLKPGADKAMVRLVTNTGDYSNFDFVDVAACPEPKRLALAKMGTLHANEQSKLAMLGTSPEPQAKIAEREIEAGQRVYILARSFRVAVQYVPGYECSVGASFVPKPGGQYEVSYVYEGNRCGVRVYRLAKTTDKEFERLREETSRAMVAWQPRDLCVR